jgi:glutathione S-transferase
LIEGIFEAHLPVKNLDVSVEFYKKLGLELAWSDEETAFFWIQKGKSWLGLWEGNEYQTPYHPSLRHIAFRVCRITHSTSQNANLWHSFLTY